MIFVIRTRDGRSTICTATAEAAAEHVQALRASDIEVEVNDINGNAYEVAGLHRQAEVIRAVGCDVMVSMPPAS